MNNLLGGFGSCLSSLLCHLQHKRRKIYYQYVALTTNNINMQNQQNSTQHITHPFLPSSTCFLLCITTTINHYNQLCTTQWATFPTLLRDKWHLYSHKKCHKSTNKIKPYLQLHVSISVWQNFTLALPSHTSQPFHWLPGFADQLSCIFIGPHVPHWMYHIKLFCIFFHISNLTCFSMTKSHSILIKHCLILL